MGPWGPHNRIGYRMATWIFVLAQLLLLAYASYKVNTLHLSTLEFIGESAR